MNIQCVSYTFHKLINLPLTFNSSIVCVYTYMMYIIKCTLCKNNVLKSLNICYQYMVWFNAFYATHTYYKHA